MADSISTKDLPQEFDHEDDVLDGTMRQALVLSKP